ncbi:transmembrane protein 232 [Aplysia californica]|uniref:Transmembrane protein 232 n=1 Tax=Aplysia californica TaxID=6500 RepID=A0ABM0JZX4_APLCA|nr:transmembrane protein 232 [Aplysia californica]
MPITKIPVVHKFGIISSSQRLELQERLLKQTYLTSLKSKKATVAQRNPVEVTEDFVQLFNSAQDFEEKEQYEERARKLLERAKRRSGVISCGHGAHVNLPLAWTEMAQLAQCKGRIQEECLDTLVTSLDVSPLEKYHIPALFFLAETMLYWLRTEAVHQPFLRTGEIKLLRMGQLVFQRLFYHHMAGQLQGYIDAKNRLFTYIDGLHECQEAYNPYPNALLSLRFIIEVGKIILADSQLEPGDIKEGDKLPEAPKHNMEELSSVTKEMYERRNQEDTRSIHSGAISSSVHDLSPTLWHALDVWRCTNSLGGGLREALKALAHCGLGLASETWVDGVVAIQILGETAKTNMAAMKVLHRLAQGVKTTEDLLTPPLSSRSGGSDMFSISSDGGDLDAGMDSGTKVSESRESEYSSKPSLSDIYERSEEGDAEKRQAATITGSSGTEGSKGTDLSDQSLSSKNSPKTADTLEEREEEEKPRPAIREASFGGTSRLVQREVSFDESALRKSSAPDPLKSSQGYASVGSDKGRHNTQDSKLSLRSLEVDRTTGWRAEAGSAFKSGRASEASSVPTFTNMPFPDTPGITGWHWEVAIMYTEVLAGVVLYGNTANIQKHALVGSNIDVENIHRRSYNNSISGIGSSQLSSAGLLDLAFFKPKNETKDGGPNDWSWRIRYGAIQSLVKICRSLQGDTTREGLRSAAWNTLLRANSMERDSRVLEALKVGQVHTDADSYLGPAVREHPTSLGIHIAGGLSVIYLPPIPPPATASPSKKTPPRPRPKPQFSTMTKTAGVKPLRTSLKQEIELATALYEQAPDYNTRKSFDLRRIMEDQWRKELQAKLEEEEEEELKALKEKQEKEEQRQRETNEAKANKFKKKITAKESSQKMSEESATANIKLGIPRNEPRLGSF